MRTIFASLLVGPVACSPDEPSDGSKTGHLPTAETGIVGESSAVRMRLPFRSEWLGDGETWFVSDAGGEGSSHAREFEVAESDTSEVTRTGPANEDHLVHRLQLHAPIDGEIITCWSGYPEQPLSDDSRTSPEGNHVRLLTDDGDIVLIGHLLEVASCPNGDGETYPADLDQRIGDWPEEYVVSGSRPRVRSGDYLGRAGRTGDDGPPRVHLEVRRYLGEHRVSESVPVQLTSGWFKLAGSDWGPLRGETLSELPAWVHASPFRQTGLATGGSISEVELADKVVAYVNADGALEVSALFLSGRGELSRIEDAEAGAAENIRMITIGDHGDVITGHRNADSGGLVLTSWDPTLFGITQVSTVLGTTVDELAMSRLADGSGFFTAIRSSSDGDLEVRAWQVDEDLAIFPRDQVVAGSIQEVAVTETHAAFSAAVTATTNASGELKLIVWPYDTEQRTFDDRSDDATFGEVNPGFAIVRAPVDGVDVLVTATRKGGELRIVSWLVDATGQIERRDERAVHGPLALRPVDIDAGPPGHVIATTNTNGGPQVIALAVGPDGALTEVGTARLDSAQDVSSTFLAQNGDDYVLSAVQTTDGLRVYALGANLD